MTHSVALKTPESMCQVGISPITLLYLNFVVVLPKHNFSWKHILNTACLYLHTDLDAAKAVGSNGPLFHIVNGLIASA